VQRCPSRRGEFPHQRHGGGIEWHLEALLLLSWPVAL
jgi:hypothetical protein